MTLYLILIFIVGFIAGYFTGAETVPEYQPGDYDKDGKPYTDKDLSVFMTRRNRTKAIQGKAQDQHQTPTKFLSWLKKVLRLQ